MVPNWETRPWANIFIYLKALIGILKIYKCQKKKVKIDSPNTKSQELNNPGLRSDNEFLQYKANMSEQQLIEYWKKPFSVKPANGFYAWTKPQIFLRISGNSKETTPIFLTNCFETFFHDDSKREKFIKLNSIEQVKGQDCFNFQKARFYHLLFEAFGVEMINHFVPYLQTFCSSAEECEQICASEIVAGLMRGK